MLIWLKKYGACIYIINTIMYSIPPLKQIAEIIFYVLMGLGIIIVMQEFKKVLFLKAFKIFLSINLINLFYYLFFEGLNTESFLYFLARFIQLFWFMVGITYAWEFYINKFPKILIISLFIILISSSLKQTYIQGRFMGIVGNPNTLGMLMSSGFALVLIYYNPIKYYHYILLTLFLLLALLTGSRAIVIPILTALILKYRISVKTVFLLTILGIITFFLIKNFGISTLERLSAEDQLEDRRAEFHYALLTALDEPVFGHGLKNYSYIDQSLIPIGAVDDSDKIWAHNGYLAVLVQLGFIFGTLYFLVIIFNFFGILIKSNIRKPYFKLYMFFILYSFIYALFESVFVGINYFLTSMFWFSFGMLSMGLKKVE